MASTLILQSQQHSRDLLFQIFLSSCFLCHLCINFRLNKRHFIIGFPLLLDWDMTMKMMILKMLEWNLEEVMAIRLVEKYARSTNISSGQFKYKLWLHILHTCFVGCHCHSHHCLQCSQCAPWSHLIQNCNPSFATPDQMWLIGCKIGIDERRCLCEILMRHISIH